MKIKAFYTLQSKELAEGSIDNLLIGSIRLTKAYARYFNFITNSELECPIEEFHFKFQEISADKLIKKLLE